MQSEFDAAAEQQALFRQNGYGFSVRAKGAKLCKHYRFAIQACGSTAGPLNSLLSHKLIGPIF